MTQIISLFCGPMRAKILSTGATLAQLQLDTRDLILGLNDASKLPDLPIYAGTIVGPIANRVASGRVPIGEALYQMPCNEGGVTTLHSGDDGLHALEWTVTLQTVSKVHLQIKLPNKHSGLPGNRKISATYQLHEDGLTLTLNAESDVITPMNLAHHPYWALDTDLSKSNLYVQAQQFLEKDDLNVPNGKLASVSGTNLDFRQTTPVPTGENIDHCLCFANGKTKRPRHVATLTASDGLMLHIDTTEAALQVYDGSGLPDLPNDASHPHPIRPFAGIALEPQGYPDAPNHGHFPDIQTGPDAPYLQITRYRLEKPTSP